MCLSASMPCGSHYGLRPMVQTWDRTYHNVRVNIFDNEVANVFDRSIAPVLIKLKGWDSRVLRWIRMD